MASDFIATLPSLFNNVTDYAVGVAMLLSVVYIHFRKHHDLANPTCACIWG